jgi:hypothetical protein
MLRTILFSLTAAIITGVAVYTGCCLTWATPRQTISCNLNLACKAQPALPFAFGLTLGVICLMPLVNRRRRWLAWSVLTAAVLAYLAAHVTFPLFMPE